MRKYFDKKNNRIIFEGNKANPAFWDNFWDSKNFIKEVRSGIRNRFIFRITKKFLKPSKKNKILEGGCGNGKFVYFLDMNNYDAYGIDYARKSVEKTNKYFPKLKISFGDVRKLNFSNNYFNGYWSLGVIEHFYNGYDDILSEMKRVIKNDGFLFLTFPYMSPLRRLKAKLGLYEYFGNYNFNKDNFYQFALDKNIVINKFKESEFKLVYKDVFDGIKGLKDEIGFLEKPLSKIYNSRNFFARIFKYLICIFSNFFSGHIILLVFQNKKTNICLKKL